MRQDEKTAVLHQEKAARTALLNRPSHPGIARLEINGRGAPAQQGQLSALILGDIARLAQLIRRRANFLNPAWKSGISNLSQIFLIVIQTVEEGP